MIVGVATGTSRSLEMHLSLTIAPDTTCIASLQVFAENIIGNLRKQPENEESSNNREKMESDFFVGGGG